MAFAIHEPIEVLNETTTDRYSHNCFLPGVDGNDRLVFEKEGKAKPGKLFIGG